MLVGFSEKLRLLNVLIDDIRPFREFMIRGCREVRHNNRILCDYFYFGVFLSLCSLTLFQCSFSHGGHLFAAANANLIQIFSAFSFDNTANLKGHNGKVDNFQSCMHHSSTL